MFNHFKKRHFIWIALSALGVTSVVASSPLFAHQPKALNQNNLSANMTLRSYLSQETTVSPNKTIGDVSFNKLSANQFKSVENIKNYVFNNMQQFFSNVPTDNTIENIFVRNVIVSQDKASISADVHINRYFNNEPIIVNGWLGGNFTFTGFLTTGLDTKLASDKININPNNSEDFKIVASEFKDDLSNQIVLNKIIQSGVITGLPPSLDLTSQDIILKDPVNVDNKAGSILVKVCLRNGKAWTDGNIVNNKELGNLTIEGFKKLTNNITTQAFQVLTFNEDLAKLIWATDSIEKFYAIDWFKEIDNPNNIYLVALKRYLLQNHIDKFLSQPEINGIKATLSSNSDFVTMRKSPTTENAIEFSIKFSNCIADPYTNVGRIKTFTYTLILQETPVIQWTDIYTPTKLALLYKKLEGRIETSALITAANDIASNINLYLDENIDKLPNSFQGTYVNPDDIFSNLIIKDDILFVDTVNSIFKFNNIILSFDGFSYQVTSNQSLMINNSNSLSWTPIMFFAGVIVILIVLIVLTLYFYNRSKRITRDYKRF